MLFPLAAASSDALFSLNIYSIIHAKYFSLKLLLFFGIYQALILFCLLNG